MLVSTVMRSRPLQHALTGILEPIKITSILAALFPLACHSGQHLPVAWRVSNSHGWQKYLGLVSAASGTVAHTHRTYCCWRLGLTHSYLGIHGISLHQFCCRCCLWIFCLSILVPPSVSLGEFREMRTYADLGAIILFFFCRPCLCVYILGVQPFLWAFWCLCPRRESYRQ